MYDDLAYILVLLQEMCQGYNKGNYYTRVDNVLINYNILPDAQLAWRIRNMTTRKLLCSLEDYVRFTR
jgi:hypothetical protein